MKVKWLWLLLVPVLLGAAWEPGDSPRHRPYPRLDPAAALFKLGEGQADEGSATSGRAGRPATTESAMPENTAPVCGASGQEFGIPLGSGLWADLDCNDRRVTVFELPPDATLVVFRGDLGIDAWIVSRPMPTRSVLAPLELAAFMQAVDPELVPEDLIALQGTRSSLPSRSEEAAVEAAAPADDATAKTVEPAAEGEDPPADTAAQDSTADSGKELPAGSSPDVPGRSVFDEEEEARVESPYTSFPGSFTGWRWVGRCASGDPNEEIQFFNSLPVLRLARTSGTWSARGSTTSARVVFGSASLPGGSGGVFLALGLMGGESHLRLEELATFLRSLHVATGRERACSPGYGGREALAELGFANLEFGAE